MDVGGFGLSVQGIVHQFPMKSGRPSIWNRTEQGVHSPTVYAILLPLMSTCTPDIDRIQARR